MKCKKSLMMVTVVFGFSLVLNAQTIVSDPVSMALQVKRFTDEVKHWEEQIKNFNFKKDYWTQELQRFLKIQERWEKEDKLFKKYELCHETNNRIWAQFTQPVGSDFRWDDLRLDSIEELLNVANFNGSGAGDPYNGLFSQGGKIEDVFPGIRDWSPITNSEKYKSNSEFKEYIDSMIEQQKNELDDYENKIKVLSQLHALVPEREKKFQEIQKRLEEYSKQCPINLTQMWALNAELQLEMSRQQFNLVFLNRVEAENRLLDELRTMNSRKVYEKLQETNKDKDRDTVLKLFEENGEK